MKFVLITKDTGLIETAQRAFPTSDQLLVFENWQEGLDAAGGADLLFVDMMATLELPNKISGYEKFAHAKMAHGVAAKVPLVLISPPADYDMDFMTGWPNFVFAHVQRPVNDKIFRRAATWV